MRIVHLVAAFTLMGATATAQTVWTQIDGSPHDFEGQFGATAICEPCHTPHNAYPYTTAPGTNTVQRALWNHFETEQNFGMYLTLAGNQGTADGTSLLCLSCHDGVTAMDNYGGGTSGTTTMSVFNPGTTAVVGTDLTDDHPIGIEYPSGNSRYNATPGNGLPLYNDGTIDRVECGSCHDPHGGTGFGWFLRDDPAGSLICLDCHNI